MFLLRIPISTTSVIPYLKRKIPHLKAGASGRVGTLMKINPFSNLMTYLSDLQKVVFQDIVGTRMSHIEPVVLSSISKKEIGLISVV